MNRRQSPFKNDEPLKDLIITGRQVEITELFQTQYLNKINASLVPTKIVSDYYFAWSQAFLQIQKGRSKSHWQLKIWTC